MSDELEVLRKKKLQELLQSQQQLKEQIDQVEEHVKLVFTKGALQRFGNIKIAHPERALQVTMYLQQLMQKKHIKEITDEQLKHILSSMPSQRDITITRK